MPTRIGTIGTPPALLLQLFLFLMQIMCFLPDYRKKQTKSKNNSSDDLRFLSSEKEQQFLGAFHDRHAGESPHGAIAPGDGDGGDGAVGGGFHVGGGVAHEDGVLGPHARPAEHFAHDLRVGFQREAGAVAQDGRERNAREEFPDEVFRPFLELVRCDGELHARLVEARHECLHARVGVCVHVDMGSIIGLEIGQGTVDEGVIGLHPLRQRRFHEVSHSVPDHCHVFVPRMLRQPAKRQGVVDGLAQVIQRIQQRPVQVEEYEFVFHGY